MMEDYLLTLEAYSNIQKSTILPGEVLELKPEYGGGKVFVKGVNYNGSQIDGIVTERGIYKIEAFKPQSKN